ncbi:MAG: SCO family protein [Hyphomicrobiales bacterium]
MRSLLLGGVMIGLAALSFSAVISLGPSENLTVAQSKSLETVAVVEPEEQSVESKPANVESSVESQLAKVDSQLPQGFSPFGENIGGTFDLIDHFGDPKQLEDYHGKHVMIFFGYANCLAICSAALPLMADTIDLLGDVGKEKLVPLMITVDPKNDTPSFMREKLAEYHASLIGMTGSDGALADVRKKFQVRTEYVGEDIDGNAIYNHGSFIYLLGPDGKFQTLVPPILGPPQMAEIINKYLTKTDG